MNKDWKRKEEKLLYAFDERKPEIGRDVYISDQAVVIGDVKIRDGRD